MIDNSRPRTPLAVAEPSRGAALLRARAEGACKLRGMREPCLAAFLGLIALSCGTKAASSPVQPSRPGQTPSATEPESAQPAPVAPATSASAPVEAANDTPAPEPPGSTLGTIACGSKRCIAGKQVCRLSPDSSCVDVATKPEGGALYCDDASDCKAGLACCQTGASSELVYVCTPRKGPDSACGGEELCEPTGAPCPKGEHCEDQSCRFDRHVTCPTGADACAKNQYCEWQAGQLSCVDQPSQPGSNADGYAAFACTKPTDCGPGRQCCTDMSEGWHRTYCALNCDLSNTTTICSSVRDCRRSLELIPAGPQRNKAKLSCAAVGDGAPPSLKGCSVDPG